jgi:excinuclease UvrABC nuclease subunit
MVAVVSGVTTLYRFFNAEDELLYVGITRDLPGRFRIHAKDKRWFKEIVRVEPTNYGTLAKALAMEATAILSESPRYNLAIPTLDRHDLLHERAELDPLEALPILERLKAAENWDRRFVKTRAMLDEALAEARRLNVAFTRSQEDLVNARTQATKALAAARAAQSLIEQREREIESLREQLAVALRPPAPTPPAEKPAPKRWWQW